MPEYGQYIICSICSMWDFQVDIPYYCKRCLAPTPPPTKEIKQKK